MDIAVDSTSQSGIARQVPAQEPVCCDDLKAIKSSDVDHKSDQLGDKLAQCPSTSDTTIAAASPSPESSSLPSPRVRRLPKRSRQERSILRARRPVPPLTPPPVISWSDENKENIDPCADELTSCLPPRPLFPFRDGAAKSGSNGGRGRLTSGSSPARPERKKRLLSDGMSNSRDGSRGSEGGNDGEKHAKKGVPNTREPLRLLWSRTANDDQAPPLFLRTLRAVR